MDRHDGQMKVDVHIVADLFSFISRPKGQLEIVIGRVGTYGLAQTSIDPQTDMCTLNKNVFRWFCGSTSMPWPLVQLVLQCKTLLGQLVFGEAFSSKLGCRTMPSSGLKHTTLLILNVLNTWKSNSLYPCIDSMDFVYTDTALCFLQAPCTLR